MTRVTLELWSDRPHLQQLGTALAELHRSGQIRLKQRFVEPPQASYQEEGAHLEDAHLVHCRGQIEGGPRLYFDFHDSHEIERGGLEWCDFYFKRSLRPEDQEESPKLRAFGLNYLVYANHPDRFALARSLRFERSQWMRAVIAYGGLDRWLPIRGFVPRIRFCQRKPPERAPEGLLLQTRLWDPGEAPSEQKAAEWERLNAFRIECVQMLQDAFGPQFSGGIANSPLARHLCPEHVVTAHNSHKSSYLRALRENNWIGITSVGLHGSTGWKFAEYVAFAMPVLSEPLQHLVPHGFEAGKNYLEFNSVEALHRSAASLLHEPERALEIAQANFDYYSEALEPSALGRNILGTTQAL